MGFGFICTILWPSPRLLASRELYRIYCPSLWRGIWKDPVVQRAREILFSSDLNAQRCPYELCRSRVRNNRRPCRKHIQLTRTSPILLYPKSGLWQLCCWQPPPFSRNQLLLWASCSRDSFAECTSSAAKSCPHLSHPIPLSSRSFSSSPLTY